MSKVPLLKPRVGKVAPRIGRAPNDERARNRDRADAQPWRTWYGTARWQRLREAVWKRDRYTCQKTGVLLVGKYPAPDSPVADHDIPHRGDPDLFWDKDNLVTVSKAYHDSTKQAADKASNVNPTR